MMKISINRIFLSALTTCYLVLWLAISPGFGQDEKITVFFYSSESNINNFKTLKMEFDSYLARFGAYEFQPFSERETFEQQIKEKHDCVVLLSSWHYENIRDAFHLTPLLVGSRKGQTRQKRLLIAGNNTIKLDSLQNGQIASAGSEQYTRMLLSEMVESPQIVDELRILTVPKDIDALMSLGFGMAKAAISTDYSLETLAKMNPVLHKKLSILAESREARLLTLATPEDRRDSAGKMVTIFQDMANDQEGRKKLRMLGLDGWQRFD